MSALSAISAGEPSIQFSLYQAKLNQARREAQEVRREVQSLEEQTQDAYDKATKVKTEVLSLEENSPRRRGPVLNAQGEPTGRLLSVQA